MSKGTFRESAHAAEPAPYDETEQYRQFNNVFIPIWFGILVVFMYGLCFFYPSPELLTEQVGRNFPIFQDRISFLRKFHYASYLTYGTVVFGSLCIAVAHLIINFAAYWICVVKPRKYKRVSIDTAIWMISVLLALIFLFYGCFLFISDTFNPRRPGMMRLFFWPNFPCIAAIAAAVIAHLSFSILIGCIKLFTWRDVKND